MATYKNRGQTGKKVYNIDAVGINIVGDQSATLADDGILTTEIDDSGGILLVTDATNDDSIQFQIKNIAGTKTTALIGTNANFTVTADNAGTINVYILAGVVVVQNKSGGIIDLTIKALV